MLRKILITGISGFAGSFLAEYFIRESNYIVSGTYLSDDGLRNISKIKKDIELTKLDLRKTEDVFNLINSSKPDFIFHLAALTSPWDSFRSPVETITNNITAQINLFEAVKSTELFNSRILVVSSADIYGLVAKKDLPIDEQTSLMPTSPYSVSKVAQDFLGLQYFISYGLKIIRVRPFNHIGPRQSHHFVVSSFAKKIAEIERGKAEPILQVGNLSAKRDFTDVRDMVFAYKLILAKGKTGEVYNIGSGISYKISDILDKLLSFSKVKIRIEIDDSLLRPGDSQELLCDNRKIKEVTSWEPKIPIETTLKETLDYWRKIV